MVNDYEIKKVSQLNKAKKAQKILIIIAIVLLVIGIIAIIVLNKLIDERYADFSLAFEAEHIENGTTDLITDENIMAGFMAISINATLSFLLNFSIYFCIIMVIIMIIGILVRKFCHKKLIKYEYRVKDCVE